MENSARFEAKTKYTKESVIRFQYFNTYRGGATGKIMLVYVALLIVLGTVSIISTIIVYEKYYFTAIMFPGVYLIFFSIFFLFIPHWNTYIIYRKSRAHFDAGIDFCFFDDHFVVTTVGSVMKGTNEVKYDGLLKVCETKCCFYLYITRIESLILSKDSFTQGTPEEFSAMLTEILPRKKFIRYVT